MITQSCNHNMIDAWNDSHMDHTPGGSRSYYPYTAYGQIIN